MDASAVDTRSLVNAFPVPAMLIDENHRVVDANTLMFREVLVDDKRCWFACHQLVHGTSEPVDDCPLDECVRTGRVTERVVSDERSGRFKVSVAPLDLTVDGGNRLYLHLVLSTD